MGDMGKFNLPANHKPYMVLAKGSKSEAFSCANCTMQVEKNGEYHCLSPGYQAYYGDSLLRDESGKKPLDDPNRACSDWFNPKK